MMNKKPEGGIVLEWKAIYENLPEAAVTVDEVQSLDFAEGFVLPDYEPEVFRVVLCEAEVRVIDYKYNNGRLTYELIIGLRVLYTGEDGSRVHAVSREVKESRSLDAAECETFSFSPRVDYKTCRAAGKRRLDVRGSVSVRVKGIGHCEHRAVSALSDSGTRNDSAAEVRTAEIGNLMSVKRAIGSVTMTESIDTGAARPDVQAVLRCRARAVSGECTVVAGKLVVRGETEADILYRSTEGTMESLHATVCQYSRIIDMEGLDESFKASAVPEITEFSVKPAGDGKSLMCNLSIRLECTVCGNRSASVLTDAYSPRFKSKCESEQLTVTCGPVRLSEDFTCTMDIKAGERLPETIHDLSCTLGSVSMEPIPEQGKLRISGMLHGDILCSDSDGSVFLIEREETFEELIEMGVRADSVLLMADAEVNRVSFRLGADGSIALSCNCSTKGIVYPQREITVLTEAKLLDERRERDDCALRIYRASAGEKLWDIAKAAGASLKEIMEENGLTGEVMTEDGMVLIPVIY